MVDAVAPHVPRRLARKKVSRVARLARTIHRYAGLAALGWLSVLGITGYILDHHDWRWSHQWTVPDWVTSAPINRLVRGTIMRHVHVHPADEARWIGASERGLWWTDDRGETWRSIPYGSNSGIAQVYRMVPVGEQQPGHVWLATDDGLWRAEPSNAPAQQVALRGHHVGSLSPGSRPDELVALVDHNYLVRLNIKDPGGSTWIPLHDVTVSGLPDTVALHRFVLELHFGKGFLNQPWSTLVNDYGGIAMAILGCTGLLFWWLPRRWRKRPPRGRLKRRQRALRWLFRSHAPVIGLLAIVPVLYLSITGVMVDHVQTLMDVGQDIPLPRESLPPIYQYASLAGEVSHVVAYPDDPERFSVATRLGVLDSRDGGRTWQADPSVPVTLGTDAGNITLLREQDMIFMGVGSIGNAYRPIGESDWTFMDVPGFQLALTDAVQQGDKWYLKNSRAIFHGTPEGGFQATDIAYPPLKGTSWFLFMADIHTGNIIHGEFKWVNDIVAILAIILTLTGPVAWWKRKWM